MKRAAGKIRCPRSPAKNRPSGVWETSAARERASATPMSCASSTTAKSNGRFSVSAIVRSQTAEYAGPRYCLALIKTQLRSRSKIDQRASPLLAANPCFSAKPRDIPVAPPKSRFAKHLRLRPIHRRGTSKENFWPSTVSRRFLVSMRAERVKAKRCLAVRSKA